MLNLQNNIYINSVLEEFIFIKMLNIIKLKNNILYKYILNSINNMN